MYRLKDNGHQTRLRSCFYEVVTPSFCADVVSSSPAARQFFFIYFPLTHSVSFFFLYIYILKKNGGASSARMEKNSSTRTRTEILQRLIALPLSY